VGTVNRSSESIFDGGLLRCAVRGAGAPLRQGTLVRLRAPVHTPFWYKPQQPNISGQIQSSADTNRRDQQQSTTHKSDA